MYEPDEATKWINWQRKQVDKGERPIPVTLGVTFWDRSFFTEMPMVIVYRLVKGFYITFWYYFSPFFALSLQFLLLIDI